MSQQTNIAAQTAFADAVCAGRLDMLAQIVAPGSIDDDPAPGQVPGRREGYKARFDDLGAAFPAPHVAADDLTDRDDELAFATYVCQRPEGARSW